MRYGDKITTGTFDRFRETLYQQHGIHIPVDLKPRDIQHLRDTEFYWFVYNVITDVSRALEVDTNDLKTVAAVLGTLWQVLQEK